MNNKKVGLLCPTWEITQAGEGPWSFLPGSCPSSARCCLLFQPLRGVAEQGNGQLQLWRGGSRVARPSMLLLQLQGFQYPLTTPLFRGAGRDSREREFNLKKPSQSSPTMQKTPPTAHVKLNIKSTVHYLIVCMLYPKMSRHQSQEDLYWVYRTHTTDSYFLDIQMATLATPDKKIIRIHERLSFSILDRKNK